MGSMTFTFASGLGDGYYPVYASKRWLRQPTALVVDFKLWEIRKNLILTGGQRLDDFGKVYDSTNFR